MLSHSRIWAALDALAARNGLSPSGLARRAGLDATSFNKSKRRAADGRERWPSTESIAKVLGATGASLDDFLMLVRGETAQARRTRDAYPPRTSSFPLLGFARAGAGGFFDDSGFPVGEGWELVDFPTPPGERAGAYALEVQGDSMLPLYRDGDVLIVEPGAQVRRGDRVVVRTLGGEVMAKVLNRRTSDAIELVSMNTEHPNRTFAFDEIEWMARIVWASQ
ncbi:S24 family peptidase [Pararhizobium mangrovi]|uniref:Helix-turn-helix transcriptional regulator n=1 Tax=Pararhizobium mangrovi TaxID=2590452 RepID=A0A506U7W8_9HYPH|nr:helix-turn-helix transcriptional regulator [Pararhizobium mangrovi]TPW27977.1 helix-turn-helix transcriptional regulator [Pararhizobium mangrovi]